MPLAHKTTPATNSALPDALKNQISNNFKKDESFSETVTPEPKVPAAKTEVLYRLRNLNEPGF